MTTTTARLTALEQVVSRIADRRGDKVSDMLKLARVRAQRGEAAPAALHDDAVLEAMAKQPGIAGRIGRAKLRLARGVSPDGLSPVGASAQDRREPSAGGSSAPSSPTRSTGLPGTSASEVAERIDRLLAASERP